MANEYLKRKPTSTGNRKTWSFSFWVKRNTLAGGAVFYTNQTSQPYMSAGTFNANGSFQAVRNESATVTELNSEALFRDVGNWMNILIAFDSTNTIETRRTKLYVNGVLIPFNSSANYASLNYLSAINRMVEHNIGTVIDTSGNQAIPFKGELFDLFFIDGQALTPDVFGFNKDGDGYISVGSTQSTDFRPGQWSPHSPRKIKTEIERRGGFGVNGFYLPMNDSSNFGADFHCTPNSIITLKGEDLPQPRNGAPTTSDAYVSQLRSDPYAANLVLAVPGISTATGVNQIVNGTFDSGTSNWTAQSGATLTNPDGVMRITATSTAGASQVVSGLTVGKRYTLSYRVRGDGTNFSNLSFNFNGTYSYVGNKTSTDWEQVNYSIAATHSIVTISPYKATSGWAEFDDFIFRQEDAPRDYSADIKGSGTNRTPTATGPAGVGYEIPSYYGSSINTTSATDALYYDVDGSGSNAYGTGDFTFECWFYATEEPSDWGILMKHATNGSWANGITLTSKYNTDRKFTIYTNDGSSSVSTLGSTNYALNQWHHVVAERYNGQLTLYVNGVAEGTRADTRNYAVAGTPATSDQYALSIGAQSGGNYQSTGYFQDVRVYKGVAKYKGGFDVSKPYTPVGFESWRQVPDTCKNNFVTMNPLNHNNATFANGNLTTSEPAANGAQIYATMGSNTGKWYYEAHVEDVGTPNTGGTLIGINPLIRPSSNIQNRTAYRSEGSMYNDSAGSSGSSSYAYVSGDIIGVAWNADNKRLWFAKNGTWLGSGDPAGNSNSNVNYTNTETQGPFIAYDNGTGAQVTNLNFGQNPTFCGNITAGTYTDSNGKGLFKYQPPSGFLALCEDNLPTPPIADPGDHFKTVLWTGDGNGGRSITGVGFAPDLVWVKRRSAAASHFLFDSVRGVGKYLQSHSTAAEGNDATNTLMSFDSDGFTSGNTNGMNQSTHNYVAWCWKAGGAAVTNTDGSITSQVSANQTAGFSIVSYTGTGSAGTVGHGLGKAPSLIITKHRAGTSAGDVNWNVSTSAIPGGYLELNTNVMHNSNADRYVTAGTNTNSFPGGYVQFNDSNRTYISYCWAEIDGYSKIGTYTGNQNADGPFVYCGFKPAFLLLKIASPSGQERDWHIYDNTRNSINPLGYNLRPSSNVADTYEAGIDFLSNGFKLRHGYIFSNYNGGQIFFAAFAESPFQTANAK